MPTVTPASYDELHRLYRPYTEKMVAKWGVRNRDEVQDIASAILTRFIERDMLSEFDPNRNVLFSTFLGGFIGAYVRYLKDRAEIDRYREGTSTDVVIGGSESVTVYDVVAPKHHDDNTDLEYLEFLRAARGHLSRLKPTTGHDKMDPVAVFDQIVLHEYEYGKIDTNKIAQFFEVSLATAKSWIVRIRAQIKILLAQHAAA